MKSQPIKITFFMLLGCSTLHAQQADNYLEVNHNQLWVYLLFILCITLIGLAYYSIKRFVKTATDEKKKLNPDNIIDHLNSQQIEDILKRKTKGTSEEKRDSVF
jgi:p-aminobenzoyl-glutamate transporter AbgT